MWKVHGKLRLRVVHNGAIVSERTFDQDKITIGRDSVCDLNIDNKLVSGRHARILRKDAGYFLEDLGSTNGTQLNGRLVKRELLREGAVATIGKHQLEFIEEGESDGGPGESQETVPPLTDQTIAANPAQAKELYAKAALEGYLKSGGKMGFLKLESGKAAPEFLKLVNEIITVGKDPEADMRTSGFLQPSVAFFIERIKSGYTLTPPTGTNKVRLNGERVSQRKALTAGDEITVGSTSFRFTLSG